MTDPAGLRAYVQHKSNCDRFSAMLTFKPLTWYEQGTKCTCGLDALLAVPERDQEKNANDQTQQHIDNIPEFYEPTFWVARTAHDWAVMHRYQGRKVALCVSSEQIARVRANVLNELFEKAEARRA